MNTIVIGSGMSGIMAAYVAKKHGDKVTLLTSGAGSFTLNSCCIDILYRTEAGAVTSPREAIETLDEKHPYKKIGIKNIENAIADFLALTKEYGLAYHGSLDEIIKVPTPIGVFKPTSFTPNSLNGAPLFTAKKIVVVGIDRLKDFYGDILADNLSKILPTTEIEYVEIDLNIQNVRDVNTIDVAHFLETDDNLTNLIELLMPYKDNNTAFLLPQILGSKGDAMHKKITEELGAPVVETTSLPPSVNGIRLKKAMRRALSDIGVNFVSNARVFRTIQDNGHIFSVITKGSVREVKYDADKVILATGGFFGGGIKMESYKSVHETIFRLPIWMPEGEANWANEKLFSDSPQGFAKAGILTDNKLRPINKKGELMYDNLYVVGNNLAGFDFCFEHSGNGVAIASGYYAAIQKL